MKTKYRVGETIKYFRDICADSGMYVCCLKKYKKDGPFMWGEATSKIKKISTSKGLTTLTFENSDTITIKNIK